MTSSSPRPVQTALGEDLHLLGQLLALAEKSVVVVDHGIGRAGGGDFAGVDEDGAVAEAADLIHCMGDQDDRLAAPLELAERLEALVLELAVAGGGDLV